MSLSDGEKVELKLRRSVRQYREGDPLGVPLIALSVDETEALLRRLDLARARLARFLATSTGPREDL